jgi:hypothetical protein
MAAHSLTTDSLSPPAARGAARPRPRGGGGGRGRRGGVHRPCALPIRLRNVRGDGKKVLQARQFEHPLHGGRHVREDVWERPTATPLQALDQHRQAGAIHERDAG